MAQYDCPAPDDLFECPYHSTHMVRASRFPYHLMKCRKNYSGNDFATCPFNARHELPRPELRYHIARCPDKHMLEQDIIYNQQRDDSDAGCGGNTSLPESDWNVPPSAENWDNEGTEPVQKVDPRVFTGERKNDTTISERKKQELFDKLRKKGILQKDSKHKSNGKTMPSHVPSYGDEPMRMPRQQPQVLIAAQRNGQVSNIASLAMQGVGRGRPVPKPDANSKDYEELIRSLARGRGGSRAPSENSEPRVGRSGRISSNSSESG